MAKTQEQLKQYRDRQDLLSKLRDGNLSMLLQRQALLGKQLRGKSSGSSTPEVGLLAGEQAIDRAECDLLALSLSASPLDDASACIDDGAVGPERNSWEVRRLLAARDCKGLSGQRERWLVALRLIKRSQSQLLSRPVTASAVLRARSELMLKVHPDKCDVGMAKHAAEAFAFLQEASSGLLQGLGNTDQTSE